MLEQWPARIGTFFGFEIGNREFAALYLRCRLITPQVCLGLACCLNVASRVGFGGKFMRGEFLVCCNIFAFLRACRLNCLCARFLGFSGWWVSFGVLHASVQVIVDGTGLILACINGLWQNVVWQLGSEIGKSEIGKSENRKIGNRKIGKSEIGKSEIGKSEIGKSENQKFGKSVSWFVWPHGFTGKVGN